MKLKNLKGRSTPDIKIEENKMESLETNHEAANEVDSSSNQLTTNYNMETTIQEYSILEKCIKQYEAFFQVYLSRNILNISQSSIKKSCPVIVHLINEQTSLDSSTESSSSSIATAASDDIIEDECTERLDEINKMFETLKIQEICRTTRLQNLLHKTIAKTSDSSDSGWSTDTSRICEERIEEAVQRLMKMRLSESLRTSVRLAANLLVEMSTFPNYSQTLVIDVTFDIPAWLKVLVLVACYTKMDKELQLAAISTLFDLISLIKSQLEHSTNPGVTYVVMIPLLKYGHVNYLEYKTRVIQVRIFFVFRPVSQDS